MASAAPNAKAWLLAIGAQRQHSWLARKRLSASVVGADVSPRSTMPTGRRRRDRGDAPESLLSTKIELAACRAASTNSRSRSRGLDPARAEEMSYKEISATADIPWAR